MKQVIGWLCLPLPLLAAQPVLAAEDATSEELDEMIVSVPLPSGNSAGMQPANILTGEELRMKMGNTIGETLKDEPGITFSSFGPGVGRPVIRGQTGVRVRVLQNSLGSNDATALSQDHADSAESLLAERVEVLRGPATLLYGNGAVGGIVNVIDSSIPKALLATPEMMLEQRFSTASDETTSVARAKGSWKNLSGYLGGFYRDRNNSEIDGFAIDRSTAGDSSGNTHGYIDNTHGRTRVGTAGASWVDDWGHAGFSIKHLKNRYGIPSREGDERDETVQIEMERTRYDFSGELVDVLPMTESLKLKVGYVDYRHDELENNEQGTSFGNESYEGRMEWTHKPIGPFQGTFGAQYLSKDFSAVGEESFAPISDVDTVALFLLESAQYGDFRFEWGARIERQRIDAEGHSINEHTPVSASGTVHWAFHDNAILSFNVSHSQRAPDVQELYADGPHLATQSYELGNDSLDKETFLNFDLGLEFDTEWVAGRINLFHSRVDDYIYQRNSGSFFDDSSESIVSSCADPDDEEGCLPVYQVDQGGARFTGFEVELTAPVAETRYGDLDLTLFSDYVRGRLEHANVPRQPPLRYGAELAFDSPRFGYASVRLTRAEKQDEPGDYETETDSYMRVDASATAPILKGSNDRSLVLFAKATNLLDEEIRNSTSFLREFSPEQGRSLEVGIRANF